MVWPRPESAPRANSNWSRIRTEEVNSRKTSHKRASTPQTGFQTIYWGNLFFTRRNKKRKPKKFHSIDPKTMDSLACERVGFASIERQTDSNTKWQVAHTHVHCIYCWCGASEARRIRNRCAKKTRTAAVSVHNYMRKAASLSLLPRGWFAWMQVQSLPEPINLKLDQGFGHIARVWW